MQKPTLTNVHIRSADDAHKVFYAVQLGLLTKIEKRLDAHERAALRPGDVYVWEKKGPTGDAFSVSMERFTEGKSWTASRVREDFLMYFENIQKPKGKGGPAQKAKSSENIVVRPGEHDQYIKQTYSVYRNEPEDQQDMTGPDGKPREPRKWHLNAYFTKLTEGTLQTIDDIPMLRDLVVPEGIFRSARTSKAGKKGEPSKVSSSSKRTFAPFPSNYRAHQAMQPAYEPQSGPSVAPMSSPTNWSTSSSSTPHFQLHYGLPPPPQPQQPQPQHNYQVLPPLSQAVPPPETVCMIPDPDDCMAGPATSPEVIEGYTPAPIPAGMGIGLVPAHLVNQGMGPAMGCSASVSAEPSYEYVSVSTGPSQSASQAFAQNQSRRYGSEHSMSPSLSDSNSTSSWRSLVSPISPSPSSSFSNLSSPMMPTTEFPVTDNGMPYQPAPSLPQTSNAGPARVDLAPLRSLRSHPYRRCPTDDKALRLLGPGAR